MNRRRLWTMWWSGMFTAAAFVHLVRALANMPVTIGTVSIPTWVSWMVFPVAAYIAGWLMNLVFEKSEQTRPQPPTTAFGGLHPKATGKEEPQEVGYCGIQAGGPDWYNDWPDD